MNFAKYNAFTVGEVFTKLMKSYSSLEQIGASSIFDFKTNHAIRKEKAGLDHALPTADESRKEFSKRMSADSIGF